MTLQVTLALDKHGTFNIKASFQKQFIINLKNKPYIRTNCYLEEVFFACFLIVYDWGFGFNGSFKNVCSYFIPWCTQIFTLTFKKLINGFVVT